MSITRSMSEIELADPLTLSELPTAWLHLLSTTLTPESAARIRTTCKLLQKVVDATWEPADVEIPPHRRSVPLTFEQVKAQLPPHKPWKPDWLAVAARRLRDVRLRYPDYPEEMPLRDVAGFWCKWTDHWLFDEVEHEHDEDAEPQDGCDPYWLEVYGPALTRLTANQAVNMLQGTPVLSFFKPQLSELTPYNTVTERMDEVREITFRAPLGAQWPPRQHGTTSTCESEGGPAAAAAGSVIGVTKGEAQPVPGVQGPLRQQGTTSTRESDGGAAGSVSRGTEGPEADLALGGTEGRAQHVVASALVDGETQPEAAISTLVGREAASLSEDRLWLDQGAGGSGDTSSSSSSSRGDGNREHYLLTGHCCVPSLLLEQWAKRALARGTAQRDVEKPYEFVVVAGVGLPAITDSSCRQATAGQLQQLVASDSTHDLGEADASVHLSTIDSNGPTDIYPVSFRELPSIQNNGGPINMYVFLKPVQSCFTGCPKGSGSITAMTPAVPPAAATTVLPAQHRSEDPILG